jgi:hypothetical protein
MKKTKSLLTIVLAGLIAISINSCSKFDEGGLISATEKNLQTGWALSKYLRNGVDETSLLLIKNYEESYADNGSYSRSYVDKKGQSKSETGTWKFDKGLKKLNISNVSSVEITLKAGTVSSSYYNIVKLDNSEFWYYFTNGADKHEFHLLKK